MFRLTPPQSGRLEQLIRCLEAGGLRLAGDARNRRSRSEIGTPRFRDASDSERFRALERLLSDAGAGLETVNLLHWVAIAGRYPTLGPFRDSLHALRREDYDRHFALLWERARAVHTRSELELLPPHQLLVDVTHTLRYTHNSGIQRVVRSLCRSLRKQGRDFRMFVWDSKDRAVLLEPDREALILDWASASRRPRRKLAPSQLRNSAREILGRKRVAEKLLLFGGNPVLLPEVTLKAARNDIYPALREGSLLRLGMIFYDFIPIFHPEFCSRGVRAEFPDFLRLARHADKVAPISHAIASEFESMLRSMSRQLEKPVELRVIPLAGDFRAGGQPPLEPLRSDAAPPLALCVGTIEPRKNGKGILLAAIEAMEQGHRFELVFAGNRGWLAEEFETLVERYRSQGYAVGIRYAVSESELDALYRRARFTLFCSFAEGFGLPILESLQRGVPCITSGCGSMREVAAGGGCLEVDPASIDEIRSAIVSLLSDEREYQRLRADAAARSFRSWDDYASELFEFFSETPG